MAKKIDPSECPKCMAAWLATFGDLMSLLLCFFVLLLSMSSMDAKKVQDAIGSLAGALSVLEGGSKTEISREQQQQDNPVKKDSQNSSAKQSMQKLQKMMQALNEMLQSSGSPKASIEESQDGFTIQLPASLLFKPDSAEITNEDALLFLRRIALIIKKMPKDVKMNVVGYTDNTQPSKNSPYSDNWSLSTARASSVTRELIKDKVEAKRIMASGKAEFDPVASNETEEGRLKNRRVELRFYSSDSKSENRARKTVLDSVKK